MSVTIALGKAGRLVVPKVFRDALGLREGSRLRVGVEGGRLEFVPVADPVTIEMKEGLPVVRGGPPLARGDVGRALREERVARDERLAAGPDRRRGR